MENDYIKRQAVIDCLYYNCDEKCSAVVSDIENISAEDVTPVRRGKWIVGPTHCVKCSACGDYPERIEQCFTDFCCLCGADMRENGGILMDYDKKDMTIDEAIEVIKDLEIRYERTNTGKAETLVLQAVHDGDIASVVRCKQCENALPLEQKEYYICLLLGIDVDPDFFCADGERRELSHVLVANGGTCPVCGGPLEEGRLFWCKECEQKDKVASEKE